MKRLLLVFLILMLTSCAVEPGTADSPNPSEEPTLQASPTLPAATQLLDTPTPLATEILEQRIEATPTPEPFPGSLAGLIYQDQQGIWKINEDETPALLFDFQGVEFGSVNISPSLDKIMYRDSQTHIFGDVVTDIRTGETVESYYGDYILCWIDWWPAQPNLLLVGLHPADEEEGRACYTVPAIKAWNGPIMETLGTEYTYPASKAGSPDGQQVAFDDFFVPWIFTLGQGKERFDYQSYDFPELKNPGFSDPLWSPSGRFLAWFVSADSDGTEEIMGIVQGIGIFDLVARTSKFISPLPVWGADGGRADLAWSPDEMYLALNNRSWGYFRVIKIENNEILYSQDDGSGWTSSWSPDGQWIAYSEYDRETEIRSTVIASMDQTKLYTLPHFDQEHWSPDSTELLVQFDYEVSIYHERFYIFDVTTGKYYRTELPTDIRILAWAAD